MKSIIFAAAALAAVADALPDSLSWMRIPQHGSVERRGVQPKVEPPRLKAPTVQGCFKSGGNLTLIDENLIYNSIGGCAKDICLAKQYPVAATMGGSQCFCGFVYPPKDSIVDNDNCNYNCTGYPTEACGGVNFWTVYNTGVSLVVDSQPNSTTTTSTTSTASTSKPTSTGSAAEVTVTAIQSSSSDSSKSGGGTNVAGIAAGVVVGVIVVAGAIGGFFLYMRRKRNKEIEEEHRRNAAVNDFFGKPPGSSGGMSMTDSRLDPVLANRRLSDGSIADNQDYSRRILRVTNA